MNRRESKADSDCYHDAIHTNIAEGVEKDTLPGQTDMKKSQEMFSHLRKQLMFQVVFL